MDLDRSEIVSLLNQLSLDTDYELIDWKLEKFGKVVGYHGSHYMLKINIVVDSLEKQLTFFVKCAVSDQILFDGYFSKIRCFEKEHYMLEIVLKELQSCVDDKLTCTCYKSELNKICILEDLTQLGYRSAGDNASRWDHIKSSVEKLAVLHAASFIMEERTGVKVTDRYPQIGFETFFNDFDTEAGITFKTPYLFTEHLLKCRIREIPEHIKKPFHSWLRKVLDDDCKPVSRFRDVVCHGDQWHMNFMFKYNESAQVEDALLVDFQVSRIGPPGLELQQFLCLLYEDKDRIKNTANVVQVYYERLSATLDKAGLNAVKILPRQLLDESLQHYLSISLVNKLMYNVTVCLPQAVLATLETPEQFVDLMTVGKFDLRISAFDSDKRYRDYCLEAILSAYKQFLLDDRKK